MSDVYDDLPPCDYDYDYDEFGNAEYCYENVHSPSIQSLYADGILDGTECGPAEFCPGRGISRWQMAVWLTRTVTSVEPAPVQSSFDDVDSSEWWAPHVELLRTLGITKGCGTDRFCPYGKVTRGQMASFLTRAFDLKTAGTVPDFVDVSLSHTHRSAIAALASNRVTVGCDDTGRFCPAEATTRAQMATFLYRARNVDRAAYRIGYDRVWGGDIWVVDVYDRGNAVNLVGDNTITGTEDDECAGDFCFNLYWRDTNPAWSPDGTRVAFVSTRPEGETSDVFVMNVINADGAVEQLTAGGYYVEHPSWSPDGTRIVFKHYAGDEGNRLYIIGDVNDPVGDRSVVRLTPGQSPDWSPDGTLIAYDNDGTIYTIGPDGTLPVERVTAGTEPAWSPDGIRIAYSHNNNIHVVDLDSGQVTQLTEYGGQNPAWSPDGTLIAYESDYLYYNDYGWWSIYVEADQQGIVVMNADGTNHYRLANNAFSPAWMPTGSNS